jgi:O-antigen/teichoic acid export membrane protein
VVFVVGIYLEKKTKYLPLVTGAGALLNVGANFVLIPKIGILGAALSTLLSYIVMAVGIYFASQRFYRVEYEWEKVIKITGSAMVLFSVFLLFHPEPLSFIGSVVKIVLLGVFGVTLLLTKVIDSKEIAEVKRIVYRIFIPSPSSKQSERLS